MRHWGHPSWGQHCQHHTGLMRPRLALLPIIPEINLTTHTKTAINFRDYVSLLFFGEVFVWI